MSNSAFASLKHPEYRIPGLSGDEVVAAPFFDGDLGELADGKGRIDEDGGVDVGGVHLGSGDARFFDQDAALNADLRGVEALDTALNGTHGLIPAGFAGHVMNVTVHVVGTGAFLFGVIEDAGAFKFAVFDEVDEFVEVGVGFARKSDDEGGANGDAWDASTDAFEEIADVSAIGLAAHESEHVVADMLEWHVDVTGDFGALGDGLDEVVTPVSGVGVEKADPEVALNLIERTDEGGERLAFG